MNLEFREPDLLKRLASTPAFCSREGVQSAAQHKIVNLRKT